MYFSVTKEINFLVSFIFLGILIINISSLPSLLAQIQSCDSGIPGDRDGDDIPDVWEAEVNSLKMSYCSLINTYP